MKAGVGPRKKTKVRPGDKVIVKVKPRPKKGTFTRAMRDLRVDATRTLDENERSDTLAMGGSETDDAPTLDELPEINSDNEDEMVLDDEEHDPPPPSPSWVPWVRLSIFLEHGQLRHRVHVPTVTDEAVDRALVAMDHAWDEIALKLITTQGDALHCSTPLEALRALRPVIGTKESTLRDEYGDLILDDDGNPVMQSKRVSGKEALERSGGQFSRDTRVVIGTPFGLAPLWFFSVKKPKQVGLYADLEQVGRSVCAMKPDRLTEAMIADMIYHPSVQFDTIRRAHRDALLAVAHHPEIVARHRTLWPMTTTDDLLDDFGIFGSVGRSIPVATLALVGAFDDEKNIQARTACRPPSGRNQL